MKKQPTERWTEQDAKDAARLLQELAQRADKASGGLKRPEQIQGSGTGPSSTGEKADGGERLGEIANSNHRPFVIAGGRDDRRDRSAIEGMDVPVAGAGRGERRFGE